MRDTLELARLNKLWERANAGEDVRMELDSQLWEYHASKVQILRNYLDTMLPVIRKKYWADK